MIEDKNAYIEDLKKRFSDESGVLDVNKLLEAKAEADITVMQRTTEAQEAREDLQSRATLEEIISRLEKSPIASNQAPQAPAERNVDPKEIAKSEVESFILETLNKQNQKATQEANRKLVEAELVKAWGTNYKPKLDAEAQKLGVSKEFVENLMATQPNVLLKLLAPTATTQVDPTAALPPRTTNTYVPSATAGQKNYKYWQKVRKENPSFYHSIEGTNERHKVAHLMGESFYD